MLMAALGVAMIASPDGGISMQLQSASIAALESSA
jgi:hypothetical protein